MAIFMIQAAYNTDGWKGLIANPQDRVNAIKPRSSSWTARSSRAGSRSATTTSSRSSTCRSNISAAAFSMAVSAGGTIKAFKTTPLMSTDEAVTAMELAADSVYAPATASETITA